MAYKYLLSKAKNENFDLSVELNDDFVFSYENDQYYNVVETAHGKLICYGYCFDVRNPETSTENTLEVLLCSNTLQEDIGYLNGQFILLYIDENNNLYTSVDATSLVPVYINKNLSVITTENDESSEFVIFNPNYLVNLTEKSLNRITVDFSSDVTLDNILALLNKQHLFFNNDNLIINYKTNKYMKALIAIMKPVLYGNYFINNIPTDKSSENHFFNSIAKDFSLNVLDESEVSNIENKVYLRNQLMDYEHFIKKTTSHKKEDILLNEDFSNLPVKLQNAEININSRKRDQSKALTEDALLFDPFNVHAIYQYLLKNSNDITNLMTTITQEYLPSLNYYDFINGYDLKQVNVNLKEQLEELKSKQITASNEQFLLNTKLSFYNVSDNLDGKLKENEILVYPASQLIEKNEKFYVSYENPGDGLIFVESFYKNKKNGQTIEVTINNEQFTIDELSKGIHIHAQSKLIVCIQYKNSRNSLPWQKAGTLLIRKK